MGGDFPAPKRRRGRPTFEPTPQQRELVSVLVANGTSQVCMAEVLHIDRKTLHKAFRHEIEHGYERIKAHISGAVVKAASGSQWGGYFGYFSDPDGYLWKVTTSG